MPSLRHPLADIRIDHVGSFLRPESLKQAFTAFAEGKLSAEAREAAEDAAIRDVVAAQQRVGLPVVSDGEFRRLNFQVGFAEVAGWDLWTGAWAGYRASPANILPGETPMSRGEDTVTAHMVPATAKLALADNFPLREHRFTRSVAKAPVKSMLMGPDRVAQMCDLENSGPFYEDADAFLADVIRIQRQMVAELVDAGCDYVQLDEPSYTGYVDPTTLARMEARGEDPMVNLDRAIAADNAVIDRLGGHATFGLHVCRGNRASMWHREGKYDAIAERLFNGLQFDRLLLEYDTERAGSFEPLRFVPKGTMVVLGLVTTKTGDMEDGDALVRRIEDAARYVPLDQIALSPQCGFASGIGGNLLSEDAQWRKLALIVETATRVWG
jgi:5-methyltetrahydropteroyltriglutamate--homocysteine methyltransferase